MKCWVVATATTAAAAHLIPAPPSLLRGGGPVVAAMPWPAADAGGRHCPEPTRRCAPPAGAPAGERPPAAWGKEAHPEPALVQAVCCWQRCCQCWHPPLLAEKVPAAAAGHASGCCCCCQQLHPPLPCQHHQYPAGLAVCCCCRRCHYHHCCRCRAALLPQLDHPGTRPAAPPVPEVPPLLSCCWLLGPPVPSRRHRRRPVLL